MLKKRNRFKVTKKQADPDSDSALSTKIWKKITWLRVWHSATKNVRFQFRIQKIKDCVVDPDPDPGSGGF